MFKTKVMTSQSNVGLCFFVPIESLISNASLQFPYNQFAF